MKLYIPEIATRLTLTKDWTFNLHLEDRNEKFGRKVGVHGEYRWRTADESQEVTLLAGSTLSLNRIYVKAGTKASGYSSLSFFAWAPNPKGKGKPISLGRFWVKLDDANRIEFEIAE